MSLIEVNNLSKEFHMRKRKPGFKGAISDLFSNDYDVKKAVNNISFNIDKGEIVGYIGPNGAGKSTTIKMLTGILVPTSGSLTINGMVPNENRMEYTKKIGVVFGQRTQLWWDIPVYESLNLMKYIYKVPEDLFKESMELFNDVLAIGEFRNTPVRQLSLGQRMRADLCASLLHNPDILYLDEPTIGLDAVVKKNIRDFISEINKQRKTTIILTTHDMADIEKLCSRVIVIDYGSIVYDGNLEQVKNTFGTTESMEVELLNEITDFNELYKLGITNVSTTEKGINIKYDKTQVNSSVIINWLMQKSKILDFAVHETEIEEAIRRMYIENEKEIISV